MNVSLKMILDLQFGSTGKGLIAGYIARRWQPTAVVTAWAPNAGHTYIAPNGRKFVHTMLANAIVSPMLDTIMIGPGSLINPGSLLAELEAAKDILNHGCRVFIHPNAAVVTQAHRDAEAGPMTKIGSTKKGVGEAMIQRIRRNPDDQNIAKVALANSELAPFVVETPDEWTQLLYNNPRILIEGAQGFSLSMYHGFYPYCTSRDVSTAQTLADCGIPFPFAKHCEFEVIGCARTYPIRVANRHDERGKQVGWSGPCYWDQREIEWPELGMAPELTTVTKLPRRIFTFSQQQIREALTICGADKVFLNFCNYCESPEELMSIIDAIEKEGLNTGAGTRVKYLGWGANDQDVIDISDYAFMNDAFRNFRAK
jgi:adenylosuccinate synthase